jgi:hypothetical protein
MNSQGELGGMNPPLERRLDLEISTFQNAPREADKLRCLLKLKQRQKDEAMHIEDTQRLVTEIEMLRLYCIWWRGAEAGATAREKDEIFAALSGCMSGSRQLVVDFHFRMS